VDEDGRPAHGASVSCDEFIGTKLLGRAVTAWTAGDGVRLAAFRPPPCAIRLAARFRPLPKTHPDWSPLLESGHELYVGTARAAAWLIDEVSGE
jgi:hypothetical protein